MRRDRSRSGDGGSDEQDAGRSNYDRYVPRAIDEKLQTLCLFRALDRAGVNSLDRRPRARPLVFPANMLRAMVRGYGYRDGTVHSDTRSSWSADECRVHWFDSPTLPTRVGGVGGSADPFFYGMMEMLFVWRISNGPKCLQAGDFTLGYAVSTEMQITAKLEAAIGRDAEWKLQILTRPTVTHLWLSIDFMEWFEGAGPIDLRARPLWDRSDIPENAAVQGMIDMPGGIVDIAQLYTAYFGPGVWGR